MADLRFEAYDTRPDGEKLYRLIIGGRAVREGLTLEQVIELINRTEEEDTRRGVTIRRRRHGHDPL